MAEYFARTRLSLALSGKGNRQQVYTTMVQPRRIRALTPTELQHLTVERLLAYRKQALCLENTLAASDYTETARTLDTAYIWFKDDQRWQPLYDSILRELARKQHASDAE
jgi:hypothetical protein